MRHIGLPGEGYQRLVALPAEEFPNLTDLADQYAEHWSDRSYTRGLTAILDSVDGAV